MRAYRYVIVFLCASLACGAAAVAEDRDVVGAPWMSSSSTHTPPRVTVERSRSFHQCSYPTYAAKAGTAFSVSVAGSYPASCPPTSFRSVM